MGIAESVGIAVSGGDPPPPHAHTHKPFSASPKCAPSDTPATQTSACDPPPSPLRHPPPAPPPPPSGHLTRAHTHTHISPPISATVTLQHAQSNISCIYEYYADQHSHRLYSITYMANDDVDSSIDTRCVRHEWGGGEVETINDRPRLDPVVQENVRPGNG